MARSASGSYSFSEAVTVSGLTPPGSDMNVVLRRLGRLLPVIFTLLIVFFSFARPISISIPITSVRFTPLRVRVLFILRYLLRKQKKEETFGFHMPIGWNRFEVCFESDDVPFTFAAPADSLALPF